MKKVIFVLMTLIIFPAYAHSWVKKFDGTGTALTTDNSGNIYVAGASSNGDFATVKYDGNGNKAWVKNYDYMGWSDYANAIAVDSASNVYVTGSAGGTTIKYSPAGDVLWINRITSGWYYYAAVSDIAADSAGNVYITGTLASSFPTTSSIFTVKYNTNGEQLWFSWYAYGIPKIDSAAALGLDLSGNVYVAGTHNGNYITIKYDTNGNELWSKTYDYGYDNARAIIVDSSGNVSVTGMSNFSDYATIKYDTNGNEVWSKRYEGGWSGWSGANAIATDMSGNIYVTGGSDGNYVTIKYNTNGDEAWIKKYDSGGMDYANALVTDMLGNIYVTGVGNGNSATIKYDTNGNELWFKKSPISNGATAIAVDSGGNAYIAGNVTIKYDRSMIEKLEE